MRVGKGCIIFEHMCPVLQQPLLGYPGMSQDILLVPSD